MCCSSNENLAVLMDDSVDAEPLATWREHVSTCGSCAARVARKHVAQTDQHGRGVLVSLLALAGIPAAWSGFGSTKLATIGLRNCGSFLRSDQ